MLRCGCRLVGGVASWALMEGVLVKQQECRMSTKHRDMMFDLVLVYLGLMKGDNRSTEVRKIQQQTRVIRFTERSFRLRNPDSRATRGRRLLP